MATKRYIPGLIQPHKRSKMEGLGKTIIAGIQRTSGLCSPIVRLEDHQDVINSCQFHPLGDLVMSAGHDKKIHIRCVYGEKAVSMIINGHTDTITEVQFSSDGSTIYSSSLDNTVRVWDPVTGSQIRLLEGHNECVNTVKNTSYSNNLVCSGSNDSTIRLWDIRARDSAAVYNSGYQVLSACFNEKNDHIITGGVDNDIKIWDIRINQVVSRLQKHVDIISGIALSPCASYLLSNSLDNTLRVWDMRPFVNGSRCVDVYPANQYIAESNLLRCAWSKDGKKIAAGSSDGHVYVWNFIKHRLLYKLNGHDSSICDVDFHPKEPIILSGSSYENLYMHEI